MRWSGKVSHKGPGSMCLGFCGPHDVHVLMPPVVTQKQPQPIHKEEGVVVIPTGATGLSDVVCRCHDI